MTHSNNIDTEFDRQHLWHPYTSMISPLPSYPVIKAKGVRLTLESGHELIDGMSSWWSAIHGYNHPTLNTAMVEQIGKMSHVMFGGLTHQPAVDLGKALLDILPNSLTKIFYCDSGSVAVEVAIKMGIQYQHARNKPDKNQLLSTRSGYHGDTWHAMSVCDPETGMHGLFGKQLPVQYFAPAPPLGFKRAFDPQDASELSDLIRQNHQRLAAVVIEPIVQGAGGMRFYSPEYLAYLAKLCKEYDVLLILDEIATGFYRTGKWFACQHAEVEPDIMCLGKAITAGMMSFAATVCTKEVANIISQSEAGVFMHGPTFMGNPLACSVALASIKLLHNKPMPRIIANIESVMKTQLDPATSLPQVADVRVLGAIGVVELKKDVDMQSIQAAFVDSGIWVRPFGRLVYIMPPYIISDEDLVTLCQRMIEVIKNHHA